MEERGVLHFTITGEFLTNFVRDLYMEGRKLNDVIEILQTSLIGEMTMEIAQGIILGKYKLTGTDNDISLEPDDKVIKPYSKQIKEKNISEIEAGWISPEGKVYGVETYFCYNDHSELAIEIVDSFDIDPLDSDIDDAMYTLEEHGWIKFTPTWVLMSSSPGIKITKEQKEKLVKFTRENKKLKVPYSIQLGYDPESLVTYTRLDMMDELMITKYIKGL